MNLSRFGDLEVLACAPSGKPRATPLLFIHGAYAAAWCWQENFLPYFADAGYACYALSLSGHGASRGREFLDTLSVDDYVHDMRRVIEVLPAGPVLIGHSMGGLVVQKYLERGAAPAAVLMASVPPQGLWASALSLAWRKPGLLHELNRLLGGGAVELETLRQAMFAQPIGVERLRAYYHRMQPESYRAIWDMMLFNLPRPHRMQVPPLLVLGAEHDNLLPVLSVELTAATYGAVAEIFAGMGHGMMLECDWLRVAERIRVWLGEQGI